MRFGRKKAEEKGTYDPEREIPVIRSSICTGEKVAGFRTKGTSSFRDIMLIRTPGDLDRFRTIYGIEGRIPEEY